MWSVDENNSVGGADYASSSGTPVNACQPGPKVAAIDLLAPIDGWPSIDERARSRYPDCGGRVKVASRGDGPLGIPPVPKAEATPCTHTRTYTHHSTEHFSCPVPALTCGDRDWEPHPPVCTAPAAHDMQSIGYDRGESSIVAIPQGHDNHCKIVMSFLNPAHGVN